MSLLDCGAMALLHHLRRLLLPILLALPVPVAAQMAHTEVRTDRIMIGTEFVPRFLTVPNRLVVPVGATLEFQADSTWDYIEISGKATCAPTHDTILRFTHLVILPGGTLECGTVAAPMTRKVEFVVRNVPIDTAVDPFQWGNGLLNFGTQTRVGVEKTSRVLTGALTTGQRVITLTDAPNGWLVGDEVLIPDTLMQDENHFPQREGKVTIAALAGKILTLSKGLDFDHPLITEPDGTVRAFPTVVNLTRNLVVRSEQPDPAVGTPGHLANIGPDTRWTIRGNQMIGLGRTTNAKIDRTSADLSHIGTNQLARYGCDHAHHAYGFGSVLAANTCLGNHVSKWGFVIHQTHDTLVEDNIAIDFAGAGFVTEDGTEVRTMFRRNFAAYVLTATVQVDNTTTNLTEGRPGTEGTGFWMHGVLNTFEDNEARNNRIGFSLVNQLLAAGNYPSAPGLRPDTPYDGEFARMAVPISNARNRMLANFLSGNEQWGVAGNDIVDLLAAYSGNVQFFNFATGFPNLIRPILVAKNGVSSCLHAGMAYTQGLRVEGGVAVGCATGLSGGGGATTTTFLGTKLQNAENFDFRFWGFKVELTNVLTVPLAGFPVSHIVLGFGKRWDGQEPLPFDGAGHQPPERGSQFFIRNWNGVAGADYLLFENKQLASEPAPYTKSWTDANAPNRTETPQYRYALPEVGLTVGEGWAKYGMAERGEALADADKFALPGLVNGWARRGLTSPLGAPSAVLMSPTMREPAPTEDRGVKLYVALVGDYTKADARLYYAFDDSPTVITMDQQPGQPLDGREFFGPAQPGTHTLVLWRKDPQGLGFINRREWRYFVGTPPPPCTTCACNPALCPPPPPTCVPPQVLQNGVCVTPPPPPVDVCPNLPGVQPTVPTGMILVNGQCVSPSPPPPVAPAGTYTYVCDAAGVCRLTFVPKP